VQDFVYATSLKERSVVVGQHCPSLYPSLLNDSYTTRWYRINMLSAIYSRQKWSVAKEDSRFWSISAEVSRCCTRMSELRYDLVSRVNNRARVTINLWANDYIALFAALHRTIHYNKGRLARTCAIYYCFGYM